MRRIGRRGRMSLEANRRLKAEFMRRGIMSCEVQGQSCLGNQFLTFAHRLKRRHMNSVEELSDFNSVILACVECHQRYLEWNKQVKEEWFKRLRGI